MAVDPNSLEEESDATVVLDYTEEEGESSAEDVSNTTVSELSARITTTEVLSRSAPHQPLYTTNGVAPPSSPTSSENAQDSDISLDFGSDDDDAAISVVSRLVNKLAYTSIAYYDTLCEGEQALHSFNNYVYTYHTWYLSPYVLRKMYKCRSHGCRHRLKLPALRVDATSFRYQLLHRGLHSGRSVQFSNCGISPVMKPEINSLLKLGMSAGRVQNMMLFKYMRDPMAEEIIFAKVKKNGTTVKKQDTSKEWLQWILRLQEYATFMQYGQDPEDQFAFVEDILLLLFDEDLYFFNDVVRDESHLRPDVAIVGLHHLTARHCPAGTRGLLMDEQT
ncbi:LOW QUALITY PROTEIN: hypothetical protein PHMEG_0008361 [Phytophthora megakarya]|uniref:Uncharacterized protein n=1 Tax=Phytophthora megakarya TaxID=4795 RepID=A0A225WJD1_9STRA|nr:LOW QUALITY PROTEIN: hypothetical protein PHMEG_0008361 [Phytophthora megakarya]